MIYRALTPGSHFVFEIEHPIYMAAQNADWIEFGGRKTWPVNAYAVEGERRSDWLVAGVLKYHRTMSTTINTLLSAGFTVQQLLEYSPSEEDLANAPGLAMELERPMLLTISCRKESDNLKAEMHLSARFWSGTKTYLDSADTKSNSRYHLLLGRRRTIHKTVAAYLSSVLVLGAGCCFLTISVETVPEAYHPRSMAWN